MLLNGRWILFFIVLPYRLAYSRVAFDEDTLHVGVQFGFSFPSGGASDYASGMLVNSIQTVLELGKFATPPWREFVLGCMDGPNCTGGANSSYIPSIFPFTNLHPDLFKMQFHYLDTQYVPNTAADDALKLGFGDVDTGRAPMNAIIGPSSEDSTPKMATILGVMTTVQITAFSISDDFTDKRDYPYLFRTVSGNAILGYELWDYVQYFGWRGANVIWEDVPYGASIRAGLLEAAQVVRRTADLFLFSTTTPQTDPFGNVEENLAIITESMKHQIGNIVPSLRWSHRLILFVSYLDTTYGTPMREALYEAGIHSPRYQFVCTVATVLIAGTKAEYRNHTNWHGFQFPVDYADPSFLNFITTHNHMHREDVTGWFDAFGISDWDHPPDMTSVAAERFSGIPPVFSLSLDMIASFGMVFSAFNSMLHDGYRPPQIQGDLLKEYMQNVSFTMFGKEYKFSENQDVVQPALLQYLDGFLPATAAGIEAPNWVAFARRTALRGAEGEITLFDTDGSEGPIWANGARGWSPPKELTGCEPGSRLEIEDGAALGVCFPCQGGRASGDYDAPYCTVCPSGSYAEEESTACTVCPPGQFAAAESSECTSCFTGSFASVPGMSACESCPVGRFQNATGQTLCNDCPAGSSAPAVRSDSCTPCEPGFTAPRLAQERCDACKTGEFQDEVGTSACKQCSAGTFQEAEGQASCTACRLGFFQSEGSAASCSEPCPVGTYASTSGSSACVECAFGTTMLLGARNSSYCTCPRDHFKYMPEAADGDGASTPIPRCIHCNEHMEDCPGGDGPAFQKEGYHVLEDGSFTYQCASVDACPGGLLGVCPEGSLGPGCASCEDQFYWDGEKCSKCTGANTFLIVLLPLCLFTMFIATYKFGNDPIAHSISNISEFIVLAGLALSIFFFFSAFSALDVSWKEPVNTLLKLSVLLSTELTNVHVSCSLHWGPAADLAITSSFPLVMVMLCTVASAVRLASPKKLFNTFSTVVYAAYLLLILHALKPFRYIVHPFDGGKSLLFMPEIFEGTGEHQRMMVVGVSVIVLYCVPFAAACVWASWTISRSKHSSRRRWFLITFRFLFYKFRPHAYYWGIVILGRNALFALTPSLFPSRPALGVFLLSAVAIMSGCHTAFIGPWRARWMTYADVGILVYMALVLNLAVGWVRKDANSDGILATFLAIVFMLAATVGLVFSGTLVMIIVCAGKKKREEMRAKYRAERASLEKLMQGTFVDSADENLEVADALENLYYDTKPTPLLGETTLERSIPAPLRWVSQQEFSMPEVCRIAQQIRNADYSVQCFFEDCLNCFPELKLYASVDGSPAGHQGSRTARRPSQVELLPVGDKECLRTIGALFAVYWICRLDLDGKRGLAFGTREENPHKVNDVPASIKQSDLEGVGWGKMTAEQRRAHFYWNFNFGLLEDLFLHSGLTRKTPDGKIEVDDRPEGRLVAMLCLTAFHDIMKNSVLCPTVQGTPYDGYNVGDVINDHDLALAYVMDRYPDVLPSYKELSDQQQRAVRFTQSEMGFNAGWLVQAEGPPSAVLGKLKKAISAGAAIDQDVAFYFAHWVTDLAGAEPSPFTGTEKFAAKFPPNVLQGLLGCFSIVKSLAAGSITEVYEQYLEKRWREVENLLGPVPLGPERIAKLRLHCMAQGGAQSVLAEFDKLTDADKTTLVHEMAETGVDGEYFSDWKSNGGPQAGTPFLTYYGPAWCQRVGQSDPELCLKVLAAVLRVGRETFPESFSEKRSSVASGSRTLQLAPLKTVDLPDLKAIMDEADTCMEFIRENNLEGTLKMCMISA
mmetsp:Transcript_2405/g.5120  ORF Transcript_2405/g.5120 Transcript_2405/m.5120 type:complete len:1794 (-) Transcript_2405:193-5574(-)